MRMPGARTSRRRLPGPLAAITILLLALLTVVAVLGPVLFDGRAARINAGAAGVGISWAHPFGTTPLGQDVLDRMLVATRLSLGLALISTLLGTAIGVIVGALPLVTGRRLGRLIVAGFNLMVAFPGLLLALFLALVFGVGARGAVLALAFGIAPWFARLTHTTATSIAKADYMSAARLLGVSRTRMVWRHVLPNIAEPLIVNATSQVGTVLLSLSALSYLGFGVQPPSYDWGRMLSDGLPNIYVNPGAAIGPCLAIMAAGIAFVLAGELLTQLIGGHADDAGRRPSVATASEPVAADDPGRRNADDVLRVEELVVSFPGADAPITPVAGVSFAVRAGEIVGVVGESGSGKSLTAMAVSSLIAHPGVAEAKVYELDGSDLRVLGGPARDRFLGTSVAMVFQDPMSALNPAIRVGRQLAEVSEVHQRMGRKSALERAVDRLAAVQVPSAATRARQYPMELSGGLRQRAMIGMGLMANPVLIVADEPTTALDVIVQRDILSLLRRVRDESGAGVLFISHDIAVIAEIASRVLVMYGGRIVEDLPVAKLHQATHPYTRALVASVPDMDTDRTRPLATIAGRPPHPGALPAGCAFAPRCPFADETCHAERPLLQPTGLDRRVACWHPQSGHVGAAAVAAEAGSGS
jgi:oligopeptide/dipeptide ABC transporter ATP-binding protein